MKRISHYISCHLSLRAKLLVSNILLTILPGLVIMLFFYHSFYQNSLNEVLNLRRVASEKCAQDLGECFGNMRDISEIIIDNRLLMLFDEVDEVGDEVSLIDFKNELSIFQSVVQSHMTQNNVTCIRIYTEESLNLLRQVKDLNGDSIFAPLTQIKYSYWKNLMDIREESRFVCTGYYLTDNERSACGSYSYVNKLVYTKNGAEKAAYIVIYMDSDALNEIMNSSLSLEGESVYMLTEQNVNAGLAGETSALGLYTMDYEDLDDLQMDDSGFAVCKADNANYYFRYSDINNTDWRLEWMIPGDSPVQQSRALLRRFLIEYGLILLLAFALSMLLANTITHRLYHLREQMTFTRGQRPVPIEGDNGTDIVGKIISTYNAMTIQINEQMDHELKVSEELYEYRLQALRAQIDPHFLYNTLDMIKWMARNGENEEVESTVVGLARFYRLALNKGKAFIRLEEELEQVTLYAELMNRRFGGAIDFVTDVSDEMMDYMVPVMIFQPLVENAIVHGILEKDEQQGCITLIGWDDEDCLYFEIADDGVGIPADIIEKINAGEQITESGSGIGVRNTRRRLEILYKLDQPSLVYESHPGEGTVIHIVVGKEPAEVEDEENR